MVSGLGVSEVVFAWSKAGSFSGLNVAMPRLKNLHLAHQQRTYTLTALNPKPD